MDSSWTFVVPSIEGPWPHSIVLPKSHDLSLDQIIKLATGEAVK